MRSRQFVNVLPKMICAESSLPMRVISGYALARLSTLAFSDCGKESIGKRTNSFICEL